MSTPDISIVEQTLCRALCEEVRVHPLSDDLWALDTPFTFPDGDSYTLFLQSLEGGGWRVSDLGHTWMHLSYENDISIYRQGTRGRLLDQILVEQQIVDRDGSFLVDSPTDGLGTAIFKMVQGLTRIHDLGFLSRDRVENTFYEDLEKTLRKIIPFDRFQKDYTLESLPQAEDYPIDFRAEGKDGDIFVFGISNRDKARLVNIILERMLRERVAFDSILVFRNQQEIPRADLARLSNAGGEMVASLDAQDDLKRKILRRMAPTG